MVMPWPCSILMAFLLDVGIDRTAGCLLHRKQAFCSRPQRCEGMIEAQLLPGMRDWGRGVGDNAKPACLGLEVRHGNQHCRMAAAQSVDGCS